MKKTASDKKTPHGPESAAPKKFKTAADLEAHRKILKSAYDPAHPRICVCGGTGCNAQGSIRLVDALREAVTRHKLDKKVEVKVTGCHGFCEKGPVVVVRPENTFYVQVRAEDADELVQKTLVEKTVVDRLLYVDPASGRKIVREQDVPFYQKQTRVILAENGHLDPTSIDDYILRDGYAALAKALGSMTPEKVIDEVKRSGLRGRGGAGFPTGRKWELCRATPHAEKYVICNADEGDPGAYMNRSELEGNPHLVIEGMIIGAYAIGAQKAYIYCRAEYPLAIEQLTKGIAQAREYGLLGENILGSDFSMEMVIKMGAGAFVCGEETALMASIEGRRGMPRPRPPFPAQEGLFAKPSNINNVETWANVPLILNRGADWFAGIGSEKSKGTKVFSLVGAVKNTGLVEVPFGTTLRHIVEDIGGGVTRGRRFKAAQMGGPSGGCIPSSQMDVKIDYESLQSLGAIVGSGGLVVMDDSTCMVDLAKFFMEFIQSESCGKCIPCREGTKRMLEILQALTRQRKKEDSLDPLLRFQGIMALQELAQTIKTTSLCGLGQTAPNPVLSTLRWFRDEYEAHVYDRACPSGACKELVGAPCQNTCPAGTEVWRYVAHIARGEYDQAYQVIREAHPFPSACARVCHHPCEKMCRAGVTGGEPVAVRTLKRFIVERISPDTYKAPSKTAAADAPRIAVVGAGPSGLTAAHYLGLMGYRVTVFEREAIPGGMLMGAIPAYRLPRELLKKEIHALIGPNVELKCKQALGRDFTLDDLQKKQGYKAVYLATGAHGSKRLEIKGEDIKEGIIPGIRFLKAYNLHSQEMARGRVGIIGGGNSAVDAARVAIRQKGVTKVTLFYRRTRNEMPAYREEVEAAIEEGVDIQPLIAPVEVLSKGGKLTGVKMVRNQLGDPDAGGRRKPVPIPGSEYVEELDTLIAAISEEPETDGLDGVQLTKWGTVAANPESRLTSRTGVFAGGDVVSGPSTVIGAIAEGKKVATMIGNYVSGKLLKTLDKVRLPSIYVAPLPTDEHAAEAHKRAVPPMLSVSQRHGNFNEVELPLSETMARSEACRCLRCDLDFTAPA
jgi:NADH-quinone oxidoreductase subunit F